MAEIRVLSQAVADKIAAGEVAERPSAVVKELVENSIDAGADRITVEIKKGGIEFISVEDNGKGIPRDQVEFAFIRHATSKLREIEDLFEIQTMGFRGEALASICAVAEVTVITKERDALEGTHLKVSHGTPSPKETVACNDGTVMVVENLFASVPARMKFLKKDSTEAGYVADVLGRIALSKPEIAFRFISDGKEQFSTSGDGSLKNTILNIYGIDHAKGVLEVDHFERGIGVTGVVGKAELARGNRTRQTLFVNGRYIKNHVVSKIVEEAYRNVLMTGKFPFFVLNIKLSPELVDVNVHPAKTEVKFANEKELYDIVYHGVKNAIYQKPEIPVAEEVPQRESLVTERLIPPTAMDKPLVDTWKKTPEQKLADSKLVVEFMNNTIPEARKNMFCEPKQGEGFALADMEPPTEKKEEPQLPEITPIGGEQTEKMRVIGQVFDTYVLAQKGDRMFMIDQHAAHERKRFEMLKADYNARGVSGQLLLTPIVLDLESTEMQTVKDNRQTLINMGFDIEEFGRNSVIIRETPYISDEDDIKELALEIIAILAEGRPSGLLSFEERLLDTVSCKYAVKANKKLSLGEMEGLLKDVEELESLGITGCPHGRPIKVEFTKREIEKMFKRIV